MLEPIWWSSIILAAAAAAILAWLIVVRIIHDRIMGRREGLRRTLLSLVLASTGNPQSEADAVAMGVAHPLVAIDLASELVGLVRGSELERLLRLLSRMGMPRGLQRRVRRGPERQRIVAAELLACFNGYEVLHALQDALDDPSLDVRTTAALALAEKGEAGDARVLMERVWQGGGLSRQLLDIMVRLMPDQPLAILGIARDRSVPVPVRAMAIEAIGRSGALQLWQDVEALCSDENPEVMAQGLRALGAIGHPGGGPAVVKALVHPSWDVRAAAAEAAGRLQITAVAPRLVALLEDENWWVRLRAGSALADMGGRGTILLRSVAQGPPYRSQRMASLVLAERGMEP